MQSKTVDSPVKEEEKRTEVVTSELMLSHEQKEEYLNTPALQNGTENRLVSTPFVSSSLIDKDVASPAELAKAYMGSRPSKVSPSKLNSQSLVLREDPILLNSQYFPPKSASLSIVPRPAGHNRLHENGFVTPRSRGKSAIYSMARTPYSRVYPTSTPKGVRLPVEGGPSSSAQSVLDHDILPGSKNGALKRRSSVLDNDIGSVGPMRRIRQKSNLLISRGLSSPVSGSPLSIARSRVHADSTELPSSVTQKPLLLSEAKKHDMKLSAENIDDTMPSTSLPPISSKSSEMASKILQQLDKLVSPKEKSSELKLSIVSDKSPTKLSPSMLRGQALRSMETVDSSKFLDNIRDNKSDGLHENLSADADKLTSLKDKVENGQLSLFAPEGLVRVTEAAATMQSKENVSSAKAVDSSVIKSVSCSPQKKRAFHMSAHEDFVDLDDDDYANGAPSLPIEKEVPDSTHIGEKAAATETVEQGKTLASSVAIPFKSSTTDVAFSTELAAVDAPSKELSKPGPIFSFGDKGVSSKESVAGALSFNFGANNNVDKVPQMPLNFSSSVGSESAGLKFGASSDSKLGNSVSSTAVAGGTESMSKVPESENADAKSKTDTGFFVQSSELAVSSAASTSSTSSTSIFSFGHSSNQNNGPSASKTSFSSSFPTLVSNNFTSQNMFSNSTLGISSSNTVTAASTSSSMTTSTPLANASNINSSSSSSAAVSSSPTPSFKFGSSPVLTTDIPVSSGPEPLETKNKQDAGSGILSSTAFSSSSAAVGSTGNGIFGFSSSGMTTVNSQSQGSVFGSSSSLPATHASPATSGFSTSTQSQSIPFGSAASFPSFGLSGNTAFPSGSSMFSSSATNTFNSGPSFGLSTSESSAATNTASSNSGHTGSAASTTSSPLFGSSSGPIASTTSAPVFGSSTGSIASTAGSPMFGSTTGSVASTASSSMFGSSTGAPSSPVFSFTPSAATASPQTVFGTPNSVFTFGSTPSANNDQMSMEDSMAEDTIHTTPPVTTPVFGQQPTPPQSNFMFAASAPSGGSPFQFGSQQNIAPHNPSPFQASGSLEFNGGGGSFSLGTGGGDKSGRKYVKVKHRPRKK
ncbi:nuclear pore complex protein NUP1 [Senna tora]|uniref:Nuclear pore complex protein NUP1 n=1 Tax=Senna tora TaxID=362788 RepID=A0A834SVZ7_9FABA|nr:nuclear pore complex protein NUP1 [Senna tora]